MDRMNPSNKFQDSSDHEQEKENILSSAAMASSLAVVKNTTSSSNSIVPASNVSTLEGLRKRIMAVNGNKNNSSYSNTSINCTMAINSSGSSSSTSGNGCSSRMSGVVVRAGETVESLFCLPPDVDNDHRQLCWEIAYGSKSDNGMAWLQALQYAIRTVQQQQSHSSSSSLDIVRLHQRAVVKLHITVHSSSPHTTTVSEQCRFQILLSFAQAYTLRGQYQEANQKYQDLLLFHVGHDQAILYTSMASFYLETKPINANASTTYKDQPNKEKAIQILKLGLQNQAQPIHSIQLLLNQLLLSDTPLKQGQNLTNASTFSATIDTPSSHVNTTTAGNLTRRIPPLLKSSTATTSSSSSSNTSNTNVNNPKTQQPRQHPKIVKTVMFAEPAKLPPSISTVPSRTPLQPTPPPKLSLLTNTARKRNIGGALRVTYRGKSNSDTSSSGSGSDDDDENNNDDDYHSKKENFYKQKNNSSHSDSQDSSCSSSSGKEEVENYDNAKKNDKHRKLRILSSKSAATSTSSPSTRPKPKPKFTKSELSYMLNWDPETYRKERKLDVSLLSNKINNTTTNNNANGMEYSASSSSVSSNPERQQADIAAMDSSSNDSNMIGTATNHFSRSNAIHHMPQGVDSSNYETTKNTPLTATTRLESETNSSSSVSSKPERQQADIAAMDSSSNDSNMIGTATNHFSRSNAIHHMPQGVVSSNYKTTKNTPLTATTRLESEKNFPQGETDSISQVLTKKRDHTALVTTATPFCSTTEYEVSRTSYAIGTTTTSSNDGNLPKFHPDFINLSREENIIYVNQKPYAKLGIIGKGGSCKVYRALSSKDCQVVAIKKVKLEGKDKGSILEARTIDMYKNEIVLLQKLSGNPSIIQMFDSEVDFQRKAIFLVMEIGEVDLNYVLLQQAKLHERKKGSSNYHGESRYSFNMNFVRLTWQQMLSAVYSIHTEHGIVHGDLKPANFLFVKGALKLIDFGIAKAIPTDENTTNIYRDSQIGTLNYMSPEAIMGTTTSGGGDRMKMKLGRASDIWSLGCILYQMVYGKTPFADFHMLHKMHAIVDPEHKISYPDGADEAAVDAMQQCLRRKPDERPPIVGKNGLLNEHWFLHSTRRQQINVGISVDGEQVL